MGLPTHKLLQRGPSTAWHLHDDWVRQCQGPSVRYWRSREESSVKKPPCMGSNTWEHLGLSGECCGWLQWQGLWPPLWCVWALAGLSTSRWGEVGSRVVIIHTLQAGTVTYINSTSAPLSDIFFPSVTICNVNQVFYWRDKWTLLLIWSWVWQS